ncbi:unnamed protein product [Cylicostephanus goldi]|uniref:Uncharacterized protein n=1 Tax=Cylicostephanus goldi TaxID=71465 RepID=A0A3P7PHX1_CYLGO|nr:unnamed protein product [Cylicostephanus goldi]
MSEAADLPWKQLGMDCIEWYNSNTLLVEIYYERMNHQVLTESPSYSLVNLVSDIGGQVGLFLGMSIISLLEFATLILLLCCYCGTHKSRKRDIEEIENSSKLSTVRSLTLLLNTIRPRVLRRLKGTGKQLISERESMEKATLLFRLRSSLQIEDRCPM